MSEWKRLLLCFVFACIFTKSWSFGLKNKKQFRGVSFIYGGHGYQESEHQSIVNGKLDKTKLIEVVIQTPGGYCGGTIIGDRFVISSANCFVPSELCSEEDENKIKAGMYQPNQLQIYIEGLCYSTAASEDGNNCAVEDRGRQISAKTLHILEIYLKSHCTSGDLAIIELNEVVGDHGAGLSDNKILPTSGDFILSGFGEDPNDPNAKEDAHMLKTVTLTAKKCEKQDFLDYFCTVEIDKDACDGDSGAGLIDKNNVIFGVVSRGQSCTTMYTSVLNHQAEGTTLKEWEGGYFTAISWHLGFICGIVGPIKGCPETLNKEPFVSLP